MTDINTDVDLNRELGIESEEDKSSGASDQNNDQGAADEGSAEELSARAKERIDALLEENKRLKENGIPSTADDDVEKFLSAVQDEPSRNLLRAFGQVMEKRVEKRFSSVLTDHQDSQFERQFAAFANDPELAPFKEDLKKTFTRNPSVSIKALVGEKLVDLRSKPAPIESKAAPAPRGGKANLDDMEKDDLYALLDSQKGN